MNFDQPKDNWQRFGLADPPWIISTDPGTGDDLVRARAPGLGGGVNVAAPIVERHGATPESAAETTARHGGMIPRTGEHGRTGSSVRGFNGLAARR